MMQIRITALINSEDIFHLTIAITAYVVVVVVVYLLSCAKVIQRKTYGFVNKLQSTRGIKLALTLFKY